jgi:alanine or glycine:cation symporter, AGCS family
LVQPLFFNFLENLIAQIADAIWGIPLLVFLLVANIYLFYQSKLIPLLGFKHALKLLGKKDSSSEIQAEGQITHFQALCNALAATIGLGNISGVAVAIYQGGAGAILWMWIAALLGMNTKFFECTLAVLFRGKDYTGQIQGGPMYYIEQGLGKKYKILAIIFAICGLIGTLSLFQINQMANFIYHSYNISHITSGVLFAFAVMYILKGGLQRISGFTQLVVPTMSILYFIMCLVILSFNYEKIPNVFFSIFTEGVSGKSISGGLLGYSVMHIIQTGIKRASFSNEAGIGTAPMAHGNAKTNEPIAEGYVAMLGPFIDTIVVCTLTALTILVSFTPQMEGLNGIKMTTVAFTQNFGDVGQHLLGVIIFLFSFSTMIGMANYNKKCWDYLFKGRYKLGEKSFILYYGVTIALGAIIEMNTVVNTIDIFYGLMAIPNILAVVLLAKHVKTKLKIYNNKYKI